MIFFYEFTNLSTITDAVVSTTNAKIFLHNTFTKYFLNSINPTDEIPLWLSTVYNRMKKPKFFTVGVDKMFELSGKSREHLSRSMKKYYNTSPSEYITNLRLEHATTLLLSSNLSITDVCFECGFGNLSWFYKLFQKKHHLTPVEYRKKYKPSFPDSM